MSMVAESVGVSEGRVRASLQSLRLALLGPVTHPKPPVKQPRPKSSISAKWGLEDNSVCYGQEKKLRVNIAICLYVLSPFVHLFHSPQKLQPLSRIKCKSYILIKQCYGHFSSMYLPLLWLYNIHASLSNAV